MIPGQVKLADLHEVVIALERFARELGHKRVVRVLQGKGGEVAFRISVFVNSKQDLSLCDLAQCYGMGIIYFLGR